MSIFLFLEIEDPPAVEVLSKLRSVFKGGPSKSPIHVTVRGPYKHEPNEQIIEKFWSEIEGEGVLLNGIRHFNFADKMYVYIQTHSPAIRKIWWKGDYPIFKYGFNPHITLYEGPTPKAKQIEQFLKKEKLEFYCHNLSLRLFKSGQRELFSEETTSFRKSSSKGPEQRLMLPYRWDPGIEDRARELMNKLNSEYK